MNEETKLWIEEAILRALYEGWAERCDVSLYTILLAGKWDESLFCTVVERMENRDGLITAEGGWQFCELTPSGVLYAEKRGAPPQEEIHRHQRARTEILAQLAEIYDKEGVGTDLHYSEICDSTGLDLKIALLNLSFLTDVGYITDTSTSSFRVTHQGLDSVRAWKKRKELGNEFDRVEALAPQPRGRALQKLLANAIEQFGWFQEESIRTSHEEMDVIIYRDREYYLVECKWVNDPVEASVVRELKGKLDNRVDVRGIVVSMSSFTAGAVEQVADYVNQRVILLFGPEDVRALVRQESTFEDLLNKKYRALVTRKQIIWQ
jgi:predicted transcriptional regulator